MVSSSQWFLPKLADHLWQATLIGLTILLAAHLLSRQSARLRHSLLLLAMAKFLFPAPLLVSALDVVGIRISDVFPSPSSKAVSYLQPSGWKDTNPLRPAVLTRTSSSNATAVCFVLASIWALGLLFLTASSVRQNRRVKVLFANAPRVAAGREFEAMRRVAGWMSLRGSVELAMPIGFLEAGVWGTRNPVLLLPAGIAQEMTDAELESVLLHEVIHVERYDNLIAALQRCVCYLFWFHPLVWILDRRLLSEREQACDELVLGMRIDPGVYASGIVKVTRFCVNGKLAGASCVTGSDMKRRLEMILKRKVLARFTRWHWILIGATACSLLALSLLIDYPPEKVLQTVPVASASPTSFSTQHTMSFWPEETSEATAEKLERTSEVSMNIDNRPGCPLMIVNASMRWLEVVEPPDGPSFAVVFRFELSNTTNRKVKSFVTSPFLPERDKLPSEGKIVMISRQGIEPLNKIEFSRPFSRPLRLTVRPESLTIRVEGVDFQDGSTWGNTGRSSHVGPPPTKVRVGGAVQSANLISYVAPVYPPLAKQARVQGDVVLEVEISREGDVTNLKVVSGHALLLDAALAAARQWKYKPTLLNGQPVEVVSQITVPFRLAPDSP